MTATPTSATPPRSAPRADQVAPTQADAAEAPPDTRDDHLTDTPGRHWYDGPVWVASFLGGAVNGYLVASVVFLLLDSVAGTESEGFLLRDAWMEVGLLLVLAVALCAPKVVVRFVERRRAGTPSSALDS